MLGVGDHPAARLATHDPLARRTPAAARPLAGLPAAKADLEAGILQQLAGGS